jgi:hypothetical protein
MTKLVNIYLRQPYDVYIGRAGKGEDGYFGNPIKLEGDRKACLAAYRMYFFDRLALDPEFKRRVDELKGKTLGCFCYPNLCHGMTIIEYLEGITVEDQMKAIMEEKRNNTFSLFDEA